MMQSGKSRSVGFDLKHRSLPSSTARESRPIESIAFQNQSRVGLSSVAVGPVTILVHGGDQSKRMQVRKSRAIYVEREDRPAAPSSSEHRRPVYRVAR